MTTAANALCGRPREAKIILCIHCGKMVEDIAKKMCPPTLASKMCCLYCWAAVEQKCPVCPLAQAQFNELHGVVAHILLRSHQEAVEFASERPHAADSDMVKIEEQMHNASLGAGEVATLCECGRRIETWLCGFVPNCIINRCGKCWVRIGQCPLCAEKIFDSTLSLRRHARGEEHTARLEEVSRQPVFFPSGKAAVKPTLPAFGGIHPAVSEKQKEPKLGIEKSVHADLDNKKDEKSFVSTPLKEESAAKKTSQTLGVDLISPLLFSPRSEKENFGVKAKKEHLEVGEQSLQHLNHSQFSPQPVTPSHKWANTVSDDASSVARTVAAPFDLEEQNPLWRQFRPRNKEYHTKGTKCFYERPHYVIPLKRRELPFNLWSAIAKTKWQMNSRDNQRRFFEAVENHVGRTCVEPSDVAHIGLGDFVAHLHTMLEAEEAQWEQDIRRYDIENTELDHSTYNHWRNQRLVSMFVPGLAEKRPTVLYNDRVTARNVSTGVRHLGFVHCVNIDTIDVSFHWSSGIPGPGRFDVQFHENNKDMWTQHDALDRCVANGTILTPSSALAAIRQKLTPASTLYSPQHQLNDKQKEFLNLVKSKIKLSICWGPPGTGKTTTVVEAIRCLFYETKNARFLVCTPTNSAADYVVAMLARDLHIRSDILRVNAARRSASECCDAVLSCSARQNSNGMFSIPTRSEIMSKRIVVSTMSTSWQIFSLGVPPGHFSHIIIDEAAQSTETQLLWCLTLSNREETKLVLAGDHKQLGAVIRCGHCLKYGMNISPLQRLLKHAEVAAKCCVMLEISYRSHPAILDLVNLTYSGKLQVAPALLSKWSRYSNLADLCSTNIPALLHHADGPESQEQGSPSWCNTTEVNVVTDYVQAILNARPELQPSDIVVLSPYQMQMKKVRSRLVDEFSTGKLLSKAPKDFDKKTCPVHVCTVEAFQGREAPVIIITCVRSREVKAVSSDKFRNIGFLSQPQRLNVATSRAIGLLVVIGNCNLLQTDPNWRRLILWFRARGCIIDQPGHEFRFNEVLTADAVTLRNADELLDDVETDFARTDQ